MKPTEHSIAIGPLTPRSEFQPLPSPKIRAAHLERLAIVYVRQSSPQQVLENRESTARQYALAQSAEMLGWPAERVLVIDEDQGQSGKTAENRLGFQRLLGEVTMEHVGIVFGARRRWLAFPDPLCEYSPLALGLRLTL